MKDFLRLLPDYYEAPIVTGGVKPEATTCVPGPDPGIVCSPVGSEPISGCLPGSDPDSSCSGGCNPEALQGS